MPQHRTPAHNNGPLLVLLGALCFSTTGSVQALFMPQAGAVSLCLVRMLGASIALFAVCLLHGQLHSFLPARDWFAPKSLAAMLGLLLFQLFFFGSLAHAGVTIGTIVTIGTTPVAVGILGWLLLREKPARIWYAATALALAGVAILGMEKNDSAASNPLLGITLAVAAGCSYAVFVIFSKELVRKRPPEVLMTGFFAGSTPCIALLGLLFPEQASLAWLCSPSGLGGAVFLVFFCTALAYVLTLRGLSSTPVALAATLALGEPLGASVLGIFLLGEPVTAMTLGGISLLFVSMALLGRQ